MRYDRCYGAELPQADRTKVKVQTVRTCWAGPSGQGGSTGVPCAELPQVGWSDLCAVCLFQNRCFSSTRCSSGSAVVLALYSRNYQRSELPHVQRRYVISSRTCFGPRRKAVVPPLVIGMTDERNYRMLLGGSTASLFQRLVQSILCCCSDR